MERLFYFHNLLFLQTEYARFENGRFVYRISRSPMCEYMINFIHKLKHLPEKYMMNSVLENFTILLVIMSLTCWQVVCLRDAHSSSCHCRGLSAAVGLFEKNYVGGGVSLDELLWQVSHSYHSSVDETWCEEPHYLLGENRHGR